MGHGMALARFGSVSWHHSILPALCLPILLHGLYDFGYFAGELAEPYLKTERMPPLPVTALMAEMLLIWGLTIVWAWFIVRKVPMSPETALPIESA